MKVRILPYALFLVACLAFAWFASRPNSDGDSSAKEWMSLSRDSIKKIVYTDETSTVTVSKDPSVKDAYWIDSVEKKKEGPNDIEVKDRYLVGDKINDLLTGFTPFKAEKIIGESSKLNLADFGLDKPSGTFEVHHGEDKVFQLLMGKRSFQSPHVFVLDKDKNTVLLVERKVMSLLEKPKARMAMVKPFSFTEADVAQVGLSFEKKLENFTRKRQGENMVWFAESKADKPSEAFRNWIDKVLKLRVEGYPDAEQLEALNKLEAKFTVKLQSDRAELDTWSVLEDTGNPAKYWLKTTKLPVPVLVDASKIPVLLNDMKAFLQ